MNGMLTDDDDDDDCDDQEEHEEEVTPPPASPYNRQRKRVKTEDPRSAESYIAGPGEEHASSTPSTSLSDDTSPQMQVAAEDDTTSETSQPDEEIARQALLEKIYQSSWYRWYLANSDISKRSLFNFKTLFGPYEDFLQLRKEIASLPEFEHWLQRKWDPKGIVRDMLILGSLRRIRCLIGFIDMQCVSFIDSAKHQEFFRCFDKNRLANKHREPWACMRPNRRYHQIDEIENEDRMYLL
ncbi:hypothetical protein FisN_14Lu117 [Fistulifera solaris]|uniref:Uncharacterized protein n=1 Tax=Fistulifera solaris TaxID=1519565 RepID=A0A1Z5JA24_FISSO|nr:hypothetical protein FisN_14Lu117 [Fistulifera solaris]|eukprot:GAX10611.1 hypothetical protein FisN_14Lu117 [Fistulifera solaris]